MVAAVVSDFFDRLEAFYKLPGKSADDWATRQKRRVTAIVDFVYDEPLGAVVFSRLIGEPEVIELQAIRTRHLVEYAAAGVQKGKAAGVIPKGVDEMLSGAMFVGGVRQVLISALSLKPPMPRERVKRELWAQLVRLLQMELRPRR
jgi:hypothetical protein